MKIVKNWRENRLLIFTLTTISVASPLGIILWRTFATHEPHEWPWIHFFTLLFLLASTLIHPRLKPLRRFTSIIVIIFLMGYGGGWNWGIIPFIRSTENWTWLMNTVPVSLYEIIFHSLRLTPALVILFFLLVTRRKRSDFFLTRGNSCNCWSVKIVGKQKI